MHVSHVQYVQPSRSSVAYMEGISELLVTLYTQSQLVVYHG
jgi:hypothetical protein